MRAFLIAGAFLLIGAAAAIFVMKRKVDQARANVQAAVAAARAENIRLKAETELLEKRLADGDGQQQRAHAAAPRRGPAPGRQAVPLAKGLSAVDALGNQGRATAKAALLTQLWAARTGDIADEASAITFSPEARARLEALEAALPQDLKSEYDTPEKLMAYILAGSPHPVGGVEVLSETDVDANNVSVQVEWQHTDDDIVHDTTARMVQVQDGWKLVLPDALVDRASDYLSQTFPAPAGR